MTSPPRAGPAAAGGAGPDGPGADGHARIARQVRRASTSFFWAMRLLPRRRREAIFAIYAFCREVDDIADDDGTPMDVRRERLDGWREDVAGLFAGRADRLLARALAPAVDAFGLRRDDFLAVIDGMEMDAGDPIRAPSRGTFDLYCDRVACAVGRLCTPVFGIPGERGRALADAEGRALQVTNILRDVHEDARRGRLYVPRDLLEAHGIPLPDPVEATAHPRWPLAWRALAAEAAGWYDRADRALADCPRAAARPARVMLEVYRENLRRMGALSDSEIADPAVGKRLVSRGRGLAIALRTWMR